MPISAGELAAIEKRLIEVRRDRMCAWEDRAVPLDDDDLDSRLKWARAREDFYDDVGPIPATSADRAALRAMKDRYRGHRAFVIGNGPSLNRTPLHLLEGEYTFGVNRIYMLFDRLAWRPTFYTTVDWRFVPDCAPEVNALTHSQLFFPERFRGMLRDGDDVTWYWNDGHLHPSQRGFATDASLGIRGAGSVTGAAIQLAFHLGFDPIHLIGCDVSYSVPDTVIQEGPDRFGNGVGLYLTSTQDDDANHFDKRYFGAGKRWHDPNVKRMIEGFQQCRDGADRTGRRIYNATVGGNLEVFDRVEFRELFAHVVNQPAPEPSLAGFVTAVLTDRDDGLLVDIGAGRGRHLAAFAALGWEVRAFEPDPAMRAHLVRSTPPHWRLFVDPRAIDARSGDVDLFRVRHQDGVRLSPTDAAASTFARARATTPGEAIEPFEHAVPQVLAVDANGWEQEILHAWPWATHRPEFVIVGVDDRVSPQLGFDRRSMQQFLETRGYDVVGIDPDQGAFIPHEGWFADRGGAPVVLVGLPGGLDVTDRQLAQLTRAHRLSTAEAVTSPGSGDAPAPGSDHADALAREIAELRASTSWRLGSGIVQAGARARRSVAAARRRIARLRP